MPRSRFLAVFAIASLLVLPRPAAAQLGGLSLWLGAARPLGMDSLPMTLRNTELYAAVQLDVPLLPIGVRGDVSFAGGDLRDGRRDATASAIFPLRLPIVQPYAMVGYGVYDYGSDLEERGVSYGGGVRLGITRLGIFAQLRRHQPLDRTIGTIGLTF